VCAWGGVAALGVFFVMVNQVLVRLWARFAVASLTGLGTRNECAGRRPQANAFRGVVVAVRVMTGGTTCVAEF
jgi:hypothetical protein